MQSRNKYSYIPSDGSSPRDMNISNEQDRDDIFLAASLCKIVVRALELEAFKDLHKRIDNVSKKSVSEADTSLLIRHLAQYLCNLRWHWNHVGIHSKVHDTSTNTCTDRVAIIIKSLYFLYFVVRETLPLKLHQSAPGERKSYADTLQTVLDDYPQDESDNGFHTWMSQGQSLVHKAYTSPNLS